MIGFSCVVCRVGVKVVVRLVSVVRVMVDVNSMGCNFSLNSGVLLVLCMMCVYSSRVVFFIVLLIRVLLKFSSVFWIRKICRMCLCVMFMVCRMLILCECCIIDIISMLVMLKVIDRLMKKWIEVLVVDWVLMEVKNWVLLLI